MSHERATRGSSGEAGADARQSQSAPAAHTADPGRGDQRVRFRHTRQAITAVEWRVGPADDFQTGVSEIRIVTRLGRDGQAGYAVTQRGWTANRDGEWEYEPIPSSRDNHYLARCRWADWEDAALMADRMLATESQTR